MLRILGFGFGIAVGVGNTIGSGIFRTPGEVAGYLDSASLLFVVWILGGIYALLCSSSVTELGTMLPTAGGWYVYSRRAFGENIGFVVGCCDWTMQCVGNAYMAVALGDFTAGLFPNLVAHVQLVAVTGLALLALLNWLGLRTGSYAQELTSLAKAIGLIALVILCFTISPKSGISAPSVEHGWNRAKLLSTNGRSRFRASSITGFDFRLWASLFLTKSLVFLTILTFSPWYRINRRAKSTRFLVRSVPALDSCKQSI